MPEKKKPLWKRALEYVGIGHSIHTVVQTEFFQTWLIPLGSTMLTGAAGAGQAPLMWVITASSIVFATTTIGLAGMWALRAQNSPQNKLTYKPVFHCDLTPREAPLIGNRQRRRSQGPPLMLSSTQLNPNVTRTLDKVQVGVEITNTALFPISFFLESAETEIEGEKPPRSVFPRPIATIAPGTSVRVMDDTIEMEEYPCQRLSGKIDMMIKYGRPGDEVFELHPKGVLDVIVESYGFVAQIMVNF
jgi:hypothetical protein